MSAAMKGNARGSGYERIANDWYVEPAGAVRALLEAEHFVGAVHDPACGGGTVVSACLAAGIEATGADIVDRAGGVFPVLDWFDHAEPLDNVICNPPFGCSVEFTEHALTIATRKVCILQQLSWLEGIRRHDRLWARGLLAQVWVFSNRISLPPGGQNIEAQNGSKAFAWYVFNVRQHAHTRCEIGWIRAEAA
jgi:hypothetical protein